MKKILYFLTVSVFLMLPALAYSEINCQSKEVTSLESGAMTSYPPEIKTVGQAIMFILASTDYKVLIGSSRYPSSIEIAGRPIPPEAEQNKMTPIYQALLLLIGKDSRLIVDLEHKLLTFETVC